MLLGDGQNGKSVFLSLLREFLGEHNVSQRALQDFSENNFAANVLEGKLANLHPDMGDDIVRDLDVFKQLTGRDTLTADVKYEKPIRFENHATLVFAANRMPAMEEDTHALWRRWIYLNFPYTFRDDDPEAKDPVPKRVLMDKMTTEEELQGLLARAVEELKAWSAGRDLFTDIMSPEAVREKMKRASEPIYDFAAVCLNVTEDGDDYLPKQQVRDAYQAYAREENLPAKAENAFGEELLNLRDYPIDAGQRREEGRRINVYIGVQFTSRARQMLGLDVTQDAAQSEVIDRSPDKRAAMMEIVEELADERDGPIPIHMAVGRASVTMDVETAEDALDALKDSGDVYVAADGKVLPT
jgi:putative DNA primase/helicase